MKKICYVIIAMGLMSNANAIDFELDFSQKKDKDIIQSAKSGTQISVRMKSTNHGGTISISGPDNFYITVPFISSSQTVNLLEKYDKLPPGRYFYEITAHTGNKKLIKDPINNGRGENNFTYAGTTVKHNGSFVVESGSIKSFHQYKEGSSSEW